MQIKKKQGGSKSGGGAGKVGGKKPRCERYERAGTREKNKRRALERHLDNPHHKNDQIAIAALRRITTGK